MPGCLSWLSQWLEWRNPREMQMLEQRKRYEGSREAANRAQPPQTNQLRDLATLLHMMVHSHRLHICPLIQLFLQPYLSPHGKAWPLQGSVQMQSELVLPPASLPCRLLSPYILIPLCINPNKNLLERELPAGRAVSGASLNLLRCLKLCLAECVLFSTLWGEEGGTQAGDQLKLQFLPFPG